MGNSVVLHLDDYPATLGLLAAVAGGRHDLTFDQLGYESTEHGARVDWTILAAAPLSANERAAVRIAHGCMTLEANGGCSDEIADVVVDVVTRVVSGERPLGSPLAHVTNAHDMWWNDVADRLTECSVRGADSLRRSEGNAFAPGALLPAEGRALPGWEQDATLAAVERLIEAGFVVRSVLSPAELPDGESLTGSPVVGGAELVVDDIVVTVVTYIDDAAEIYTRVSQASWPTDLDE
jgi:hypothetical protein